LAVAIDNAHDRDTKSGHSHSMIRRWAETAPAGVIVRTACVFGKSVAAGLLTVLLGVGVGAAADGATLWTDTCAPCHGPDGKGDTSAGKLTRVPDLTAAEVHAGLTVDKVRKIVVDGIIDETTGRIRMRGFKDKFSSEELDALSTYTLKLIGAAK
jgi:mono/diheme cytochrome c family protein